MSIFDGISDVSVSRSGRYIEPGFHNLTVREIKKFESSKKEGQWFFCVEFDVDEYRPSPTIEHPAYSPGQIVTWLVNLERGETALRNIRGFAEALLPDVGPGDIDPAAMDKLCESDQVARGIRIQADAVGITTSRGNPFTKVNWIAVTDA